MILDASPQSVNEGLTGRQIGMIYGRARQSGLDLHGDLPSLIYKHFPPARSPEAIPANAELQPLLEDISAAGIAKVPSTQHRDICEADSPHSQPPGNPQELAEPVGGFDDREWRFSQQGQRLLLEFLSKRISRPELAQHLRDIACALGVSDRIDWAEMTEPAGWPHYDEPGHMADGVMWKDRE